MTESTTPETFTLDGKTMPVEVVDGRRQAKDENGNVYVLSDKDGKFAEPVKGPTKLELKRAQAHLERCKRLINKGVDPSKVEQVIAEEDYRALPVEKKFDLLVGSVRSAITGFARDLNELRHNDGIISDVIDVNARAFAKIFTKLGVTPEDQSTLIKEAEAEIRAELQKRMDDAAENQRRMAKQQAELAETKTINDLKKAEAKEDIAPEQVPVATNPIPEGATTFGD